MESPRPNRQGLGPGVRPFPRVEGIKETNLVQRARSGDQVAADCLVRMHEGSVFAVALARSGDPHLARDVAQEAFVKVLSDLSRLRDASKFGAYVVRTAIRIAADKHRKRRPAQPLQDQADPRPGPLDRMQTAERRDRLFLELERLPEETRRVFLLRHVEGAPYSRIAALLEIPEGTVGWVLHRARKSLASSLADLREEER